MNDSSVLEFVLKRDRLFIGTALAGITVLAWAHVLMRAVNMGNMSMDMVDVVGITQIRSWTLNDFVLMLLMWIIMMVGMMIPSASPMILLFARVSRSVKEQGCVFAPVAAFLSGYLVTWVGFSIGAVLLQWVLDQAALLSPMMVSTSPVLGGLLLIGAGVYQWTSLKSRCLTHCRSPVEFINRHWRNGTAGALRMGMDHGFYCLGCCWVLMGLLFVGGVMNLLWIAAIAAFVFLEKIAPFGIQGGRIGGLILAMMGVFVLVQG